MHCFMMYFTFTSIIAFPTDCRCTEGARIARKGLVHHQSSTRSGSPVCCGATVILLHHYSLRVCNGIGEKRMGSVHYLCVMGFDPTPIT